jgi:hypothetical protein
VAGIVTLALTAHGPPEGEGHPQAPRHQGEAARPLTLLLRGGNYVAVTRSNTVPPAVPASGGTFFFLRTATTEKFVLSDNFYKVISSGSEKVF